MTAQLGGIKILVSNRVPPFHEVIEKPFPYPVSRVKLFDLGPELETEPAKVTAQMPRSRITSIKLPIGCQCSFVS
jgi:hypothetical protein